MNDLTGQLFADMAEYGLKSIKLQYKAINDLNVFPVPDGDTGTNMTATINGGVKSMQRANRDDLADVAKKMADGMLLGARGNSGVILSQFFAGLSDGLQGKTHASVEEFTAALQCGVDKAYKAVIKPVEGTILTVARESVAHSIRHQDEIHTLEDLLKDLIRIMKRTLQLTPTMLDVLKEAGVVDSGGAGLIAIFDGFLKCLTGEEIEDIEFNGPAGSINGDISQLFNADSVLTYGYCTEFILQLLNVKHGPERFSLQAMIDYYSTFGDSIVAIQNDTIVKVHIHTTTPDRVIEYAQNFGEFVTFKMENMSIQHEEVLLKEMTENQGEKKEVAIVAVASSQPIAKLFKELGVTETVSGGQTMNPSAEDILNAIKSANAKTVIVFPNNGNIVLTAEQAAKMVDGVDIRVIKSKSVVECYSALGLLDFESMSVDENINIINDQIHSMKAVEFTNAIHDSTNNGLNIKKGDFIGIGGGEVIADAKTFIDCVKEAFKAIEDMDDRSVITAFYGEDATDADRKILKSTCEKLFPMIDFIEIESGQEVYRLILAIE